MATQKDLFDDFFMEEMFPKRPASARHKAISIAFAGFRVEDLNAFFVSLLSAPPPRAAKPFLVEALSRLLDFRDQSEFEEFFVRLPGLLRKAIELSAFEGYLETEGLEREFGEKIVRKTGRHYYDTGFLIDPSLRLGIFVPLGETILKLPSAFRSVFALWLPKPESWTPEPIIPAPVSGNWRVDETIAEILPLAASQLKGKETDELIRKGFRKTEARSFDEGCGLSGFPVAGRYGISPGELLARFLASFGAEGAKTQCDGLDFLKGGMLRFFESERAQARFYDPGSIFFEFRCLTAHIGKRAGSMSRYDYLFPKVRHSFRDALSFARSGQWFSLRALFDAVRYRNYPVSLSPDDSPNDFFTLNGEELRLGKNVFVTEEWQKGFVPAGPSYKEILDIPLFKAYCYLFATLGILEIHEEEPERRLRKKAELKPLSPYDGLHAVRITPLGAWCLGFSEEKPARQRRTGFVLADSDLPILTIKGESLQKRVLLETIGEKLGEERYRVTEASFIAGCETKEKIEERITRFKDIIEGEVPRFWIDFLESVRAKSEAFAAGEAAFAFTLPDDERLKSLFFLDPALRSITIRAEGGRIIVLKSDSAKFAKLLRARGFCGPNLKNLSER